MEAFIHALRKGTVSLRGYVSFALPPETMERIDQHLAECPACREFYEGNDDLAQVLSRGNEIAHPGDDYLSSLSSRILENLGNPTPSAAAADDGRIEAILASGRPGPRPLWIAGGLAAAALLVAGLMPVPEAPSRQIVVVDPQPTPLDELLQGGQFTAVSIMPQVRFPQAGPGTGIEPVSVSGGHRSPVAPNGSSNLNKSVTQSEDQRSRLLEMVVQQQAIVERRNSLAPKAQPEAERAKPRWTERVLFAEVSGQERDTVYEGIRAERAALGKKVRKQDFAAARELDQCLRYGEAELAYREGRNEAAREGFEFVAEIDPTSALAQKASLRLADYYFDVSGDFARATKLYQRCMAAQGVFTARESARIISQLSCLAQYARNDWASLRLLQTIRQGTWEGAIQALSQIESDPDQKSIRSEAGRIIAERVHQGAAMPKAQAQEMLNLLTQGFEAEADTLAKAWLMLAAAEILWTHFESSDALKLYSRVIRLETRSKAAVAAQARLKEIGARVIEGP